MWKGPSFDHEDLPRMETEYGGQQTRIQLEELPVTSEGKVSPGEGEGGVPDAIHRTRWTQFRGVEV
jgi:hypothetical protein